MCGRTPDIARDRPTSFRSPWQNGHVERLIGSIRRECTDHLIAFNASTFGAFLREMQRTITRRGPTFRWGRMRRGDGQPRALET